MKAISFTIILLTVWIDGFSQNVGIGTTTPSELFTVKTNGTGISQESQNGSVKVGFYTDNTQAYIRTHSNHPLYLSTGYSSAQIALLENGNVGVGTTAPAFKLDIAGRIRLRNQADGNSAGIWFNNPANTNTIGFAGVADAATMGFFGNPGGWGLAMNTNTGNVGIKTLLPANKLQIGSLGSIAFNGNDFAIGNGTNAMVINQSNASTLLASSTDIVLRPRNNGEGRVGINTLTPRAPLEVAAKASLFFNYETEYGYYARNSSDFRLFVPANYPIPDVSIIAGGRVYATEFNAYSDARIKMASSISNSVKDLETIEAIKITDYIMKDRIKYGNKPYKKVLAQEVEKVYPQVVSQHTDFVPNVYQPASKIEKMTNGYRLSFTIKHNITATAKKLRLMIGGRTSMDEFEVVSIPSDNEVIIKADDLKGDKAFVYGEEVADFRTVDYEGLTTLNISATQQLSKLVKQQQAMIDALVQEIKLLKEKGAIVKQ